MPIVAPLHPILVRDERDRPPRMAGLLYGLLLALPLWAVILMVAL